MSRQQINRKVSQFLTAAEREKLYAPEMIQKGRAVRFGGVKIKIFEVQSVATGDGVYNCYQQTLDSTEWDDYDGNDKFDDKDITEVEVLNLFENQPQSEYTPAIGKGTRLACWQWLDDGGEKRWVGIPLQDADQIIVKNTSGSEISANRFVELTAYNVNGGYYEIELPSLGYWGFSQVVQKQLAAVESSISSGAYGIAKIKGIAMVTKRYGESISAGDPVGSDDDGKVVLGGPFVTLYMSSSNIWVQL